MLEIAGDLIGYICPDPGAAAALACVCGQMREKMRPWTFTRVEPPAHPLAHPLAWTRGDVIVEVATKCLAPFTICWESPKYVLVDMLENIYFRVTDPPKWLRYIIPARYKLFNRMWGSTGRWGVRAATVTACHESRLAGRTDRLLASKNNWINFGYAIIGSTKCIEQVADECGDYVIYCVEDFHTGDFCYCCCAKLITRGSLYNVVVST